MPWQPVTTCHSPERRSLLPCSKPSTPPTMSYRRRVRDAWGRSVLHRFMLIFSPQLNFLFCSSFSYKKCFSKRWITFYVLNIAVRNHDARFMLLLLIYSITMWCKFSARLNVSVLLVVFFCLWDRLYLALYLGDCFVFELFGINFKTLSITKKACICVTAPNLTAVPLEPQQSLDLTP